MHVGVAMCGAAISCGCFAITIWHVSYYGCCSVLRLSVVGLYSMAVQSWLLGVGVRELLWLFTAAMWCRCGNCLLR